MWTRKELKAKAKKALAMNYWKAVLVGLLAIFITGGFSAVARSTSGSSNDTTQTQSVQVYVNEDGEIVMDPDLTDDEAIQMYMDVDGNLVSNEEWTDIDTIPDMVPMPENDDMLPAIGAAVIIGVLLVVLVVGTIALAIEAFIINPLKVGITKFFVNDLNRPAELKDVSYGFDNNYRETVKTMFWKDIYTMLWGLLLVVPGIIKNYEYRMIPYLLAEDPTMTKDRAFAESKRLMNGQKWNAFLLDMSFLGWIMLSIVTLGLALVFYVQPYKCLTDAALYERLRFGDAAPTQGAFNAGTIASAGPVPVPSYAAADMPQPAWDDVSTAADDAAQAPVVDDLPEA